MALSGDAHASLASGGQSITLTRAGKPVLRYDGLTATDARGHVLHSWLQLQGNRLLLRVDAAGARYPLRIDPFVQQGKKLTGGAEESGPGAFGVSVALSADGNTALIGGYGDKQGTGAAWVFTRSGSTWTQQGKKLTAKASEESQGGPESQGGLFGFSVALSVEGTTATAVIGAPFDNGGAGAAWVFTRSGTTWTQQGKKLTGSGEEGEALFGETVALAAKEGNTALIGGSHDHEAAGAAWVFTRSGTTWTQQGEKLTAKSEEESEAGQFGISVALSAAGTTALIGGPADAAGAGAAWVFTRTGTTWTQQGAKLTGEGESGAGELGNSVALSSEGNTALVGGRGDNSLGAAWVFTRSGSTWTQQGEKLTAKSEEEIGEGGFGSSVALSAEGNKALIGAPNDNGSAGAAWVFTRSGTTWTQLGEKLTGGKEEVGEGFFGVSVALGATEGNTALIGGFDDNTLAGAAWVFTFMASVPTVVTKPASAVTQTTATLNATVNPNGGEVKECTFEYGLTNTYGKTAPCTPSPGSGSSPVAVSAAVTGLTLNTGYHFRVSATNSSGPSKGSDETFKTLCSGEGFCTTFTRLESREVPFEPSAVAVDPSGNVWVGDSAHDHVLEFNSGREFVRQVGKEGAGEGQFKGIGGVATDASGDVYVTDSGNNRVEEFSSSWDVR